MVDKFERNEKMMEELRLNANQIKFKEDDLIMKKRSLK